MIRPLLVMIATAVVLSTGYAQTGGKKDNPGEVEILFANGSLVRMAMVQDKIDILTLYGKLIVPLKDIRRIEFGLHVPDGMDKKVDAAVKQLASADFKEREAAVRELVALGVYTHPALLQASTSTDLEVAKRATDAVARIRAKVPAKELRLGDEDRVVTRTFTIVGRIVTPVLKARTEYFGEAQLSLAQIRTLRVLVDSKDADVAVDAAKYAVANEWLETNVTVDGNSVLTIAATGQVDLLPRQPGMVVCGPQGYGAGAPGAFGGPGGFAGPGKKGGKGAMAARAYSGVLLGRIGENGNIFVIGERYEGAPEREGKLYLHINPSQYDTASTGAYQVRISTRY